MADTMHSGSESEGSGATFQKLEALLTKLRAAASEPSRKKRFGAPAPDSQGKFKAALVEMVAETINAFRATAATQETRLQQIAQEISEVRSTSEDLDRFRERSDRLETELRSAAANVRALQERAAALETAVGQARDEQADRVQHVLDEQRVCIRQLSLQASEEAVLADRARRATELKLEELARRIAPPPA
jgi:chromosome segregation ATPase